MVKFNKKAIALVTIVIVLLVVMLASIVEFTAVEENQLRNIGRATFNITSPKFDCKSFRKSVRRFKELHLAFVYNTFGNDTRCLAKLMKDKRLKTLEVHLINEPGQRNGRSGSYEFLYNMGVSEYNHLWRSNNSKLIKRFKNYVVSLQDLFSRNLSPSTQCLISPGLESNVDDVAAKNMIVSTRSAFPNCRVVWNPLKWSGQMNGADLIEQHGTVPKFKKNTPCITNLDGADIDFPERPSDHVKLKLEYLVAGAGLQQYIEQYANMCEVVFLWTVEDNCGGSGQSWMDPRKRSCRPKVNVNPLIAKEILYANKYAKVYPDTFIWTEKDNIALEGCDTFMNPYDGAKVGFILKDSHVSGYGSVILLPARVDANKVFIQHRDRIIDTFSYTGNYWIDKTDRPIWRSNRNPDGYPFYTVVKAVTDSKTFCWKLDNARIRVD